LQVLDKIILLYMNKYRSGTLEYVNIMIIDHI